MPRRLAVLGAGLLLGGILLQAPPGGAVVYKWVQPDGTVVYSDTPPPGGGGEASLPELVTVPATPVPEPEPAPPPAAQRRPDYRVRIVQPPDDAALRENTGRVVVRVAVEPPLRPDRGHRLVLLLDGRPLDPPLKGTQVALENVDRGTHTLAAQVVDERGRVLASSPPVTFHLHRISVLLRPRS